MMSENDSIKYYLRSVGRAQQNARLIAWKIERLTAQIERITPMYSGLPGGGSSERDAALANLADLKTEYKEKLEEALRVEAEVQADIDKVESAESRAVLFLRYCAGLRWPEVLDEMTKANYCYSERQMYRIHGRALNEIKEILRGEANNDDKSRDT